MSNPGVIEVINDEMSIGQLKIEDNIGEAIHIHIADFRIDLTIAELHHMSQQLKSAVNEFVDVEGFDCDKFDSVFLNQISDFLVDLEKIEIKDVKLSSLYTDMPKRFGGIEYRPIRKSRVSKALKGNSDEDISVKQTNAIGVTNSERTRLIYESIKEKGYPSGGKYAVIFGDSNYVRDGQHRLSALYILNGEDIEIPVIMMKFKNNSHAMSKHPRIDYFLRWDMKRIKKQSRTFKVIMRKALLKVKFFCNM